MKTKILIFMLLLVCSTASFAQLKRHETIFITKKPSKVWYTDSQNRLQGTMTFYNADSSIKETLQYKDDKRHGKHIVYDSNAKPVSIYTYENDNLSIQEEYGYYESRYRCLRKLVYHNTVNDTEEHKYNHITDKLEKTRYISDGILYDINNVGYYYRRDISKDSTSIQTFNYYAYIPAKYESISSAVMAMKDTVYTWFDTSKKQIKKKDFYATEYDRAFYINYDLHGREIENSFTNHVNNMADKAKRAELEIVVAAFIRNTKMMLANRLTMIDSINAATCPAIAYEYFKVSNLKPLDFSRTGDVVAKFAKGVAIDKAISSDANAAFIADKHVTTKLVYILTAIQSIDKTAKILEMSIRPMHTNLDYSYLTIINGRSYTDRTNFCIIKTPRYEAYNAIFADYSIQNREQLFDVLHSFKTGLNTNLPEKFDMYTDTVRQYNVEEIDKLLMSLMETYQATIEQQYLTTIKFANGKTLQFIDNYAYDEATDKYFIENNDKIQATIQKLISQPAKSTNPPSVFTKSKSRLF